jgi:hypothetical protein
MIDPLYFWRSTMLKPGNNFAALTRQARAEFGVVAFWSIPLLPDPSDDARNVGRQLAKHGGLAGLRLAAQIERALLAAGERSWR